MRNRLNRERWLHDVEARQRNVVFPDTVQNEGRFWRNLGNQGWTTTSKIGLLVLGIFVFGALATILLAVLSRVDRLGYAPHLAAHRRPPCQDAQALKP
jgi:hypothetical protein